MIYSLYVFDRHCECIYFLPLNTPSGTQDGKSLNVSTTSSMSSHPQPPSQPSLVMTNELTEHCKLVYGVIYSIRNFVNKLKRDEVSPPKDCVFVDTAAYICFATSHFTLHFLETLTRMQWVLVTSRDEPHLVVRDLLLRMYQEAYVPYVVKNPLATTGQEAAASGASGWIGNAKLRAAIEQMVRAE